MQETLEELQPRLVLILGKGLSYNLPELLAHIVSCVVRHSSSFVRYSDFTP